MNKEDLGIQIHKMIIKKDNITIITDKVQEAHKNMKIKEIIIMATQILDKIDLKDLITFIILKKLIREKVHPIIIRKEDFKAIDFNVHTVTKMTKREDFKIEGVRCKTENMEIFISKKMIDAIIVKKRVTLLENVKSPLMETIET